MTDTVDPLAGSYFVESLTDAVEADAWAYLDKIDGMGGAVAAIEAGYMQEEIEQAAYAYAKAVDSGEKVIVGVNRYVDDDPEAGRGLPHRSGPRRPTRSSGCGAPGPSATRRRSTPPWPTWPPRPAAPTTCCPRCGRRCAGGPPSAR